MAIGVSFISFIIPIENIEKHYPGGFKQYKSERDYIIHDDFIVRIMTMNPWDMETLAKEHEGFGFVGVVEKDGIEQWQDFCVVEGAPTLPCEWIRQERDIVYHKNDKERIVVNL